MKKLYITLVALILGLAPAYSSACQWSCGCICGGETPVERITPTQISAAPETQAMEVQTPAATPLTVTITPALEAEAPAPVVRRKPLLVPLTEDQAIRRLKHKTSSIKARETLKMGLPGISEGNEEDPKAKPQTLPIPLAFSAKHPIPRSKKDLLADPDRILLNAVKGKEYEKAKKLLEGRLSDVVLNKRSSQGKTPLHYAIQHKYWDIVQNLLLRREVDLPSWILVEAIKNKWDTITDTLLSTPLSEVHLNAKNNGKTPILYAIQYGRWDIVEQLLSHPGITILPSYYNIQSVAPKGQEKEYVHEYIKLTHPGLR